MSTDEQKDRKTTAKISEYVGYQGKIIAPINLIHDAHVLYDKARIPFLDTLHFFANAIPPLRLAVAAVTGFWEIIHALFLDQKSAVSTRALRIGISISLIVIVALAVAFPPLAGFFLIAAAGVALAKEFLGVATAALKWYRRQKKLNSALPEDKQRLQAKLRKAQIQTAMKLFDVVFAVTSVVGYALLVTPLAPVGVGLLIGVSALGITVKAAPAAISLAIKGYKKGVSLYKRFRSFLGGEEEKEQESPKPAISPRDQGMSEADLRKMLRSDASGEIKQVEDEHQKISQSEEEGEQEELPEKVEPKSGDVKKGKEEVLTQVGPEPSKVEEGEIEEESGPTQHKYRGEF